MTSRTTLTAAAAAVLLACALPPTRTAAQVELTDEAPSYIEMSPEELRAIVGRMQRLRVQRARQYAYLDAQRRARAGSAAAAAPVASGVAPSSPASAAAPVYAAPAAPSDPAHYRQLEGEIASLTTEMRLLREEMQRGLRQNPVTVPSEPTAATRPYAYDYDAGERDRALRDLRDEYERALREERDRSRYLERDLADARRDGAYRLDRGAGPVVNALTPAVAPAPLTAGAVERGRDTVIVERAGERVIIRDTIRDTRLVTRTLTEDRVDLAAALFAHNSTVIDPAAELQIKQAVEAYRREPSAALLLRGFASKTGRLGYNQDLSRRRAEAVRDRLTAQGVPLDHIRIIANGVDPVDDLPMARRVEIQLVRRPG